MRLDLDIDFTAFAIVQAVLDGLDLEKVGAEAVTQAGAAILNRLRTRYLAMEGPDGVGWEPSKAAFLRSFGIGKNGKPLKRGSGGGTGFDTGTLFHSIQLPAGGSPDPLETTISTDVPYAGFFNDGTIHMPARPFMGFSDEDYDIGMGILADVLDQEMKALK